MLGAYFTFKGLRVKLQCTKNRTEATDKEQPTIHINQQCCQLLWPNIDMMYSQVSLEILSNLPNVTPKRKPSAE